MLIDMKGSLMRRNFSTTSSCLLVVSMIGAQHVVAAEDDPLQLTASVQGISDSNFSRTPFNDSEQLVLSSAGLRFDNTYGRQRLTAKWQSNHYKYDEHPDFDTTTNTGQLNWKGLFASQINTDIDFRRNSYQVDRLEYFGKDIVTRDDFNAKIGYGNDNKLSFHVGGRQSKQTHSNDERNYLDFEEDEAFVDVGYQTSNKSNVYLRYKSGERTYTHASIDPVINPGLQSDFLDFDYNQVELEGEWILTPKTSVSGLVARYKRDGNINDASGSLANISAEWQATEKVNIKGGYTFNEPAIGETSDSPSRVKTVFVSALWQFSSKLSFGSSVSHSIIDYGKLAPEFIRQEKLYSISPLTATFDSGRHWKVKLESGWRKNESPVLSRNYTSRQISAGLFFYY